MKSFSATYLSRGWHQKHKHQLRHCIGVGAGRVCDLNAARSTRFDIDRINASAMYGDDLEVWQAIQQRAFCAVAHCPIRRNLLGGSGKRGERTGPSDGRSEGFCPNAILDSWAPWTGGLIRCQSCCDAAAAPCRPPVPLQGIPMAQYGP